METPTALEKARGKSLTDFELIFMMLFALIAGSLITMIAVGVASLNEQARYAKARDIQQINAILVADDEWRIRLVRAGHADYDPSDEWKWRLLTPQEIAKRAGEGDYLDQSLTDLLNKDTEPEKPEL